MTTEHEKPGKPEKSTGESRSACKAAESREEAFRRSLDLQGCDRAVAELLQSFLAGVRYPWERDFANAAAIEPETTDLGPSIGCAANAAAENAEGEWVRLAVYGDHPYGATDVQVLDRQNAEELAGNFRSAANSLLRRVLGSNPRRPVYAGHPDHPAFAAHGHDDFTIRGEIEDLEARDDGLYAKTRFTKAGKALLSGGEKLFSSPRWVTRKAGKRAGKTLWKPVKLLSSGLTPTPNIYGSAANAELEEKHEKGNDMELLKKILLLLGYTDEQAEQVVAGAEDAPSHEEILAKLTPEDDDEPTKEELAEDLDAANAKFKKTKKERDAALADLANERQGRATLLVEQAIEQGRVTAADRESEIKSLAEAADFANAATALLTRAKVLPGSGGKSRNLGQRKGEMQDMANATEVFNSALKDFANDQGLDLSANYQAVYSRFVRTPKGHDLRAKMRGQES